MADYLFLIFGINYEEKISNKKAGLINKANEFKINSIDLLGIISNDRKGYYLFNRKKQWNN